MTAVVEIEGFGVQLSTAVHPSGILRPSRRCVVAAPDASIREFGNGLTQQVAGNGTDARRSVISKLSVILLAFSQGGAYTLSELAEHTGLPVSTTHRLATELVEWRVLERSDDRRFRPGLSLRTLGGTTCCTTSIRDRAAPVLEDLSRATGAATRLGLLDQLCGLLHLHRTPISPSPSSHRQPPFRCTPRRWERCCWPSPPWMWSIAFSTGKTQSVHAAHDHRFGSISMDAEAGQGTSDGRRRSRTASPTTRPWPPRCSASEDTSWLPLKSRWTTSSNVSQLRRVRP